MLLNVEARRQHTELVIGLVGAVGSNLGAVQDVLLQLFSDVGYASEPVHLIELLHEIDRWERSTNRRRTVRIEKHMDAGDEFRKVIESDDALAVLGVGRIQKLRFKKTKDLRVPASRAVYILKSLKHPHEVATLREIYGPGFFLVAAYSPREERVQNLATRIARSHNSHDLEGFREQAERLMSRDQRDAGKSYGQNVRHAFPLADVFVGTTDENSLQDQIQRFVRLVLGDNSHTPNRDEYAMFHAYAAALRSGSLSRQVGAAIVTPTGEVIALGTNEVPKYSGGQYWCDDDPDDRDIQRDEDSSDLIKRMNVGEILDRLSEGEGWLVEARRAMSTDDRVRAALPILKNTRVTQLLEFGRAVHAEMAAITDAARRGVAVQGSTLYTTTFPCHECARHIIAAGILKVIYIEPYPKSLAATLHDDAISVEGSIGKGSRVCFEPFVGVAPRQYLNLFPIFGERKTDDGTRIQWSAAAATPRLPGYPESYIESEKDALELLYQKMENKNLKPVAEGGE
ncbi:MAG: anti-phage dCTP deaminase [Terriglobales bacterium]